MKLGVRGKTFIFMKLVSIIFIGQLCKKFVSLIFNEIITYKKQTSNLRMLGYPQFKSFYSDQKCFSKSQSALLKSSFFYRWVLYNRFNLRFFDDPVFLTWSLKSSFLPYLNFLIQNPYSVLFFPFRSHILSGRKCPASQYQFFHQWE